MAITHEQLKSIINRSRELCSETGDRLVNEHINNRSSMDLDDPDPSSFDYVPMESIFNEDRYEINEESFEKSNLPENIKNSMRNHQIRPNTSILDEMDIKPKKKKMPMNESVPYQQAPVSQQAIDYSIIRAIMKECIDEYFKKKPLNEGSLVGIGLKGGKITLVDNKGNKYMAKLEKVEND